MRGILWCAALLCAASGAASEAASGAASGGASGAASGAGPQCAHDQPCTALGSSNDEHFFTIRDIRLTIKYSEERHFIFTCGGVTLDDPALPALPRRAPVALVRLAACAPPRHGYARVLGALNVSLADAPNATLELSMLPTDPPLRAAHLAALRLSALTVEQLDYNFALLPLEPALLGALPALRELRLYRVALPAGALLGLPRGLRVLRLESVAGAALDAAALARLPELDRLFVDDETLQELDLSATPLRDVTVRAPLRALTLGARVQALELWHAVSAELRGACAALRRVSLENVTRPLPARWLARCGGVRELRVLYSPGALGGAELEGASALRVLDACACDLLELPPRWLADAGQLRVLNLSSNRLTRLPSLAASRLLEELWAQDNQLDAAALGELGELGARGELDALRVLRLGDNPLGHLCPLGDNNDTNDVNALSALSPLAGLRGLRELGLRGTGLTALCRDWRLQMPRLERLDLRDNRVTGFTAAELQWRRDVPAEVDLRGNDVRVHYTRDDYRAALQLRPDPQAPLTTLLLDSWLQCGCDDYWFARAWRERPGHARVALRTLRCRGGAGGATRELLDVPLDELLCDEPENDTSLASQDIKEKKDDDLENFVKYVESTLRILNANNIIHAQNEIQAILSKYKLRDLTERQNSTPMPECSSTKQ